MSKGTVSINAENIMPVIKQWLYSDKDIFVRELVSNGCDAIKKYRWLASSGQAEAKGWMPQITLSRPSTSCSNASR